ncbi:MAG: EpsI family protein [Fimbriimonas ginsengisoli]|uniref:EpsI family protein n=1 Tax=Fimbriimonas ginsengisoli TaxID=1005039 RepID=A0A931PTB3_FIMGI|nr:EpsI family protein [Fimbriimonas ginsengisoli]
MEGLRARLVGFGAAMLAVGLWIHLSPAAAYERQTEPALEAKAPGAVGDYRFVPGLGTPGCSYKMDYKTYRILKPYGIVARVYESGAKSFDVVLVASQNRGSFHDPRVCFTAQGWSLDEERLDSMQTPTRGTIPFTVVRMTGPRDSLAMYFYRGPQGFCANVIQLKLAMFKERLTGGKNVDGVFYRIIPNYEGATVDDLKAFASEYLAAASESSGGYF